MCQALREWMDDSRNEGWKEGLEEGRREERKLTEMERQRADLAEQELLALKVRFGIA
ncbi:MAG: hypothetical protein LUF35_07340 [Lachnospiraceae bacterium]|nr:hypothetical protein [Lachnospiraceae bacterium]